MENLRDKMLGAMHKVDEETMYSAGYKEFAEACARVAEEEIAKAFDEAITYAERGDSLVSSGYLKSLKDKYLKSLK